MRAGFKKKMQRQSNNLLAWQMITENELSTRWLTFGKASNMTTEGVLSRPLIRTHRHEITSSSGTDRDDDKHVRIAYMEILTIAHFLYMYMYLS